MNRIFFLCAFMVILLSACSVLAPSTNFKKVESAPDLKMPEIVLDNRSDYDIEVEIGGALQKQLAMKKYQKITLKVTPGYYVIKATCPDSMDTSLYLHVDPKHRYIATLHLGMK